MNSPLYWFVYSTNKLTVQKINECHCPTSIMFFRIYLIKVLTVFFFIYFNVSKQPKSYLFIDNYNFGNAANHFIKLTLQFKITTWLELNPSKIKLIMKICNKSTRKEISGSPPIKNAASAGSNCYVFLVVILANRRQKLSEKIRLYTVHWHKLIWD